MEVNDKVKYWNSGGGRIVCIAGESGNGKSSLAKTLYDAEENAVILDGDVVRHFVTSELGYSLKDRTSNNQLIAKVALMLAYTGKTVFIATVRADLAYEYIKAVRKFDDFSASIPVQLIHLELLKN